MFAGWTFWIPAFAGMTGGLVVSLPIYGVVKANWYNANHSFESGGPNYYEKKTHRRNE